MAQLILNQASAIGSWFAIRIPTDAPAMAAGITKRLWEIGDIVDVLEAWGTARQHNAVAA